MRIRSLALGYLVALGMLAFAGALAVWSQSWVRLTAVREMDQALNVLQPAMRHVERLALERGAYNQVLIAKGGGPSEASGLIAPQVAETDALFTEIFDKIDAMPEEVAIRLREPVRRAFDTIRQARAEAEPIWQDPQRTSLEAATALVASYTKAGADLEEVIARGVRMVSSHDIGIGLTLEIARLSNDIRELAGQRSTLLTRYVATREPFSLQEWARVSEYSGAIRATWQRLERVSAQLGSPGIERAVASVRRDFFEQGEPVYIALATAARDGAEPQFRFSDFRIWTVAMLNRLLATRDAPIEQALRQTSELRTEALDGLRLVLIALGAGLCFVFVSAWLIESRIVRPLSLLTEALDEVGTDDKMRTGAVHNVREFATHYASRNDEIGSLARGLSRLHRHAVDLERLYLRFTTVLSNMPQGVCFYDADGVIVMSNRRFAELYDIDSWATRPGVTLADVQTLRLAAGSAVHRDGDDYIRTQLQTLPPGEIASCMIEQPRGRVISVQGTRVPGGGWLSTHLDVTERTRAQAQIAHMANHDSLTGLPNRTFFQSEMARGLKRIHRGGRLAIMCLDLDRFKWVNDTLGHSYGDELLKQVSKRLQFCVRETDFVARLGGDEFAIISDDIANDESITRIAQRIIEVVGEPYELDGHQAVIGTSIGIAVGPQDGRDAYDLLKAADMALYRAKGDGRGTYRFFEAEMDEKMQRRRALEIDLRQALQTNALELHYQPIVSMGDGEIVSLEALLRWNHPTRGRVSPLDFISIAEETGLIVDIGAWVLRQACLEAKRWPKPVKVSVNLSPRQFASLRLLTDVSNALRESGLPASRLELEITEQVMLANTETVLRLLHDLRTLGVRIAMDDFGTGYSSLSYLRKFPFDKIKIDQSFVRDLRAGTDSVAIVRAVVELATGLGMTTTAEGVETREQYELLAAERCTEAQGYLMSRPVPAADVPGLLVKGLTFGVAA